MKEEKVFSGADDWQVLHSVADSKDGNIHAVRSDQLGGMTFWVREHGGDYITWLNANHKPAYFVGPDTYWGDGEICFSFGNAETGELLENCDAVIFSQMFKMPEWIVLSEALEGIFELTLLEEKTEEDLHAALSECGFVFLGDVLKQYSLQFWGEPYED